MLLAQLTMSSSFVTSSDFLVLVVILVIGTVVIHSPSSLGQTPSNSSAINCTSPQVVEGQIWAKEPVKFNVEYVIGYSDKKLSCFEIVEIMDGRGYKVNMTFDVIADGAPQHAEGVFDMDDNNIGTVTLHDENQTVFYTSPDIKANGVVLLYVCLNDKQYILVQYVTEQKLRKEAKEAAEALTEHPELYKIAWDDCQPQAGSTPDAPSFFSHYIGYAVVITSGIIIIRFFCRT